MREYWLADPDARTLRSCVLGDGRDAPVAPDPDGRLRSSVLPELVIDPAGVLAVLDE